MTQDEIAGFWLDLIPRWALAEAIFMVADQKIADVIGDGPTSLATIAEQTGNDPTMLGRMLNALAAHGIFARIDEDSYGPTPLSTPLRSDAPGSYRPYIGLGRLVLHDTWTAMPETLRTGRTAFDIQFGAPSFEYFKQHPAKAAGFAEAMSVTTKRVEQALIAADPFGDFDLAIDIGGSFGSLLRLLLAQRPNARGIVFDLPDTAAEAARRWADAPDADRLQAIGGSFFESVPAGGDLYLLKQILHDWTDEQSVTILKAIRAAIPAHGRVALVEMVLPDDGSPHPGWMYDLLMMSVTGGRERTGAQYAALLEKAGFALSNIHRTQSPMSVVEARPN